MISGGACPLQLLFSRLALSVRLGGGGICAWADLREGRSRRASKTCVRCDLRTTFGLVVDLLFSECARARFSKDATTGTLAFEFLGCCGVNDTRGMAPIFLFAFGSLRRPNCLCPFSPAVCSSCWGDFLRGSSAWTRGHRFEGGDLRGIVVIVPRARFVSSSLFLCLSLSDCFFQGLFRCFLRSDEERFVAVLWSARDARSA